jgi:hypothetical protein
VTQQHNMPGMKQPLINEHCQYPVWGTQIMDKLKHVDECVM